MKKYDVTALGELLVDFTENGISEQGNALFEANPGGAPCNVLSMLQKLGKRTAFIGKVGQDAFGLRLKQAAAEQGIDVEGVFLDQNVPTTLALVSKLPDGDRDFSFYRSPGADMMLRTEELDREKVKASRIFHFGSLSMTGEPVRSATREAVRAAEDAGVIRSFDPNLRLPLWPFEEAAREQISWGMAHCDVLKISDNEIRWFTGCEDFDEGVRTLKTAYPGIRMICLSMGADGSRVYCEGKQVQAGAFKTRAIETTGAGDTFCACVLNTVLDHGLEGWTEEELKNMLIFANAAASIVTTRKGALRVMPEEEEVRKLLREQN